MSLSYGQIVFISSLKSVYFDLASFTSEWLFSNNYHLSSSRLLCCKHGDCQLWLIKGNSTTTRVITVFSPWNCIVQSCACSWRASSSFIDGGERFVFPGRLGECTLVGLEMLIISQSCVQLQLWVGVVTKELLILSLCTYTEGGLVTLVLTAGLMVVVVWGYIRLSISTLVGVKLCRLIRFVLFEYPWQRCNGCCTWKTGSVTHDRCTIVTWEWVYFWSACAMENTTLPLLVFCVYWARPSSRGSPCTYNWVHGESELLPLVAILYMDMVYFTLIRRKALRSCHKPEY